MKTSFNELKARNILSKEQMQNVKGGGSCGYIVRYTDGSRESDCNVSQTQAQFIADRTNRPTIAASFWCCDSCASTSYCG